MPPTRNIPATLEIGQYIHCGQCIEELPEGLSAQQWQKLEIGFTRIGIQVWCRRHKINVMHIDLEGHKHPANTGIN